MVYQLLTLNFGSTSSKVGVFNNTDLVKETTIRHPKETLNQFKSIDAQKEYRKQLIENWLDDNGFKLQDFDLFSVRCGLIRPIQAGIYHINQAAVNDALSGHFTMHAANLGLVIGYEWMQHYHIPAIFSDGPTTDELSDLARISGFAFKQRRSVFHALNTKRTIRLHCQNHELNPFENNFIVGHLGGGITISAFQKFRAIDVNNGIDGEGPFTPERTGTLSNRILLELVDENDGNTKKVKEDLYRFGGLHSYFQTNDVKELVERAHHDPQVKLVIDAMIYMIAKEIGAMASVLKGDVKAILITGGLAYSEYITSEIINATNWIAPVVLYPGENELQALAESGYRYLMKEEIAKELEEENV